MAEGQRIGRRGLMVGAGALALSAALPSVAEAGQVVRPALRPELRPVLPGDSGPPGLQAILERLPSGARGGAVVIEAASGRVLEAQGETIELPPGSMQKTITSLYALDRLGAGRRLDTRVLGSAPVGGGGVLEGDLWLVGGGDPTLDTDRLGDLVARLRASGLRKVTGRCFYDASVLPNVPRIAADQPEDAGYNPGLAGLLLNYDRVYFKWTRDAGTLEMLAQGVRYRAPVHVATMQVVSRDQPVFERADKGGVEVWTVSKRALQRAGARWLPVRHVAPYVADVFRGLCAEHGIALPSAQASVAPSGAVELVADQSATALRHPEGNAEIFHQRHCRDPGAFVLGCIAALRPRRSAMELWATSRLGLSAKFVDHSGLGAAARVAPLDLARALRAGDASPSGAALRGLMKAGPLLDSQGRRHHHYGVMIHAKSGTLNFVSGLTGFIDPPNGRRMIFAIRVRGSGAARQGRPVAVRAAAGDDFWLRQAHMVQADLVRRWAQVYGGAV